MSVVDSATSPLPPPPPAPPLPPQQTAASFGRIVDTVDRASAVLSSRLGKKAQPPPTPIIVAGQRQQQFEQRAERVVPNYSTQRSDYSSQLSSSSMMSDMMSKPILVPDDLDDDQVPIDRWQKAKSERQLHPTGTGPTGKGKNSAGKNVTSYYTKSAVHYTGKRKSRARSPISAHPSILALSLSSVLCLSISTLYSRCKPPTLTSASNVCDGAHAPFRKRAH